MTIEELSKKVRKIREENGLSQYNIWKQGMNFGTVIAIESGKNVNLNNFLKYCEIVGIDVTLEEKKQTDNTFNKYKNKRNMNNSNQQICIGKTTDSFEVLKKLCEEKAKSLFRDMMQQASFDFGFEAENIPLMIEAIPLLDFRFS